MPLLTSSEALHVGDSFLKSLYGKEIFRRWKCLKAEMQFITERDYVTWLMDLAESQRPRSGDRSRAEVALDDSIQHSQAKYDVPPGAYHLETPIKLESAEYSELISSYFQEESASDNESTSDELPVIDMETGGMALPADEGGMKPDNVKGVGGGTRNVAASGSKRGRKQKVRKRDEGRNDGSCNMRKYSCPYCAYCAVKKNDVERHVKARHERRKQFSCPHSNCDFASSWEKCVKTHMMNIHGEGSPSQQNVDSTLCAQPSNSIQV